MALQSVCDNCMDCWTVDALVHIEAINSLLCPVCINQLVDLCFSNLTNAKIEIIKQDLEDF